MVPWSTGTPRVSRNGVLRVAPAPDYIHFRGLSAAPLGEGRFVQRLPYFKRGRETLLKSACVRARANYVYRWWPCDREGILARQQLDKCPCSHRFDRPKRPVPLAFFIFFYFLFVFSLFFPTDVLRFVLAQGRSWKKLVAYTVGDRNKWTGRGNRHR